jgi:exodeoxyribonuclease VII small subunit
MNNPELTFEQAYQELVALVERLEAGNLSLEESLNLYERGQVLSRWCNAQLDNAELRITQISTEAESDDE